MGLHPVTEDQLERVIEELEIRCWEKVQTIVKTEEGLGIEYDENVICDVCRSPDSEEGNEMVFCDSCNICVHQACYGITTIPSGSWLCRTCALSLRPECVLCPNKGGAMKCTRSGQKWAHVSCALWIPEVSIGCVERMEPITKISSIPQSRWALICVLCRERVGACIQCSVKTCKTAYHVTCAFKHGLEMRAIIEDENADDGVKLRSYCQKHSVTSKKEKSGSASEDEESKRKKRKDMTSEEKNQARAAKLQEIEAEFDKHVSIKDITQHMDVDPEGRQYIYNYWKLKRKAGFNKPLLPPKSEDADILSHQQEQADLEKMKMFVQLRQDLERVRNLCYMVSRREKLSRSFFRMREQTFHKQVAVLSDASCSLKGKEVAAVIEANHGPSIYDRLYSEPSALDHSGDFDLVLARIAGIASPRPGSADEKSKTDLNGLVKCSSDKKASLENPYKRLYFNGAGRRRSSLYGSMSSGSETDTAAPSRGGRHPSGSVSMRKTATRLGLPDSAASSTEEEEKHIVTTDSIRKRLPCNKKNSISGSKTVERKRCKKTFISRTKAESSSEEEEKPSKSLWQSPRSRTLRQMEQELGDKVSGSDDTDDLMLPVKATKSEPNKINAIYSDSDSELSLKGDASGGDRNESKSPSNIPSDSQQHVLRTKAAMKEFSAGLQAKVDKSAQKNSTKLPRSLKKEKEVKQEDSMDDDFIKDKENVKSSRKKEYDPTDLIVPQRQAAKKATESIRCSQGRTKEQILFEQEAFKVSSSNDESKVKQKVKHKTKDSKTQKDGKSGSDVYDFEKDSSDPQEILAYVPQRQAAKKAAAHIKSGMSKPVVGEPDAESLRTKKDPAEVKCKKEPEVSKNKKEQESEKCKNTTKISDSKVKSSSKSHEMLSSSSTSSSSDVSSSSSTDSDHEIEEKLKPSSKCFKKDAKSDKKATIEALFSTQKENSDVCDKKTKPVKERKKANKSVGDWPFVDKVDQPMENSSSSSDSDTDDNVVCTKMRQKSRIKPPEEKNIPSSRSKPKSSDVEDRKGPNSKSVGKKFKKAPDKKLKTSDRRPELEFQPPIVERDEPSRAKEKPGRGRKLEAHKTLGSGEKDRVRNADSRSGDLPGPKNRDDSSPCDEASKREQVPGSRRNRSRTPRVEEQPKRSTERESDAERGVHKKDQYRQHEARKRKSNEVERPVSTNMCRDTVSLPRSGDSTAEISPLKERAQSSEHMSPSTKKTEKKLDVDGKRSGRVPQEATPGKDSLGSQLEREISERKAGREILGKKTSKMTLDKLFYTKPTEKEGKQSDKDGKLAERGEDMVVCKQSGKHAERDGDRVVQKQSGKTAQEKESKKDAEKNVTSKHEKHKSPESHVKVSAVDETSSKRTCRDKDMSENHDVRKINKDQGSQMDKDTTPKASKHNSVITSNMDKDMKDTVIRKVEKSVVAETEEREHVLKKDEIKKPEFRSLSGDDLAKEMRRGPIESGEEDDRTKKKVKPMPRCKKKALGILSDADGSQEEQGNISEQRVEDTLDGINPSSTNPEEIPVVSVESSGQPTDQQSTKEMVAPVLTPELTHQESKTAANSSFTLMPHLEKACALDLGSELQVPEKEAPEAKKITSRSSSLNVPTYPQRSIFSPQQPSKDPPVSELFDFENDILAVDETVNDGGFSIARDSEEIMRAPPLTFSFSSEFLFKEDSKEDSARETHLLVEKLRLEYAKKTTTNVIPPETAESLAPVPDEGTIHLDDISDEKPESQLQVMDIVEGNASEPKDEKPPEIDIDVKVDVPANVDCSVDSALPVPHVDSHEPQPAEEHMDKNDVPPYVGGEANGPYDYHACNMQLEVAKVSIPGREKLDRSNSAQADERWVPPSMDFVSQQSDQHHGLMPPHHYETLPPAPLDCTPAPSPYTDLRNRAKWTESEMIPARRSSSSSASSTSSSSHREEPDPTKRDDLHLPPHTPSSAEHASYQGLHPGLPPYLTDAPPYHPYSEASPFVGSVALFPPPACTQMPYPSPSGMYPPFGPPFPTPHSLLAPVPKPPEDPPHMPPPCAAAFTSSSHNMALTAAMVSPPPSIATPSLLPPAPSPVMHSEPPLTPSFVPPQESIQQMSLQMSPLGNNRGPPDHHHSSPAAHPVPTPPSSAPTPSPAPPTPQQSPLPPRPPPPPVSLSESQTPKVASSSTAAGKKSPAKPTRTSARFISQQGKSPGKSPRQQDTASSKAPAQSRLRETGSSKRSSASGKLVNRVMYNQPRGGRRGRGRGRGQHMPHFAESDFNTIHSKLVGTVYDLEFDDDSPSESVENLRAMRERRRSTDMHERKLSESTFLSRDSPPSPKFTSLLHQVPNSKLRSSYTADIRDLRPPSPLPGLRSSADELLPLQSPVNSTSSDRLEPFPDVVQPLLPGPVDMRTYSSSYEPTPSNNPTPYHNHLLGTSFSTSTAEQHVADFVEDLEKELHSALAARKPPEPQKFTDEVSKQTDEALVSNATNDVSSSNKVSLSDSRNQLKVKIKGPFLDANYAAASAVPPLTQQQPLLPVMPPLDAIAVSNIIPAATTAISSAASSSGTSNLRRMRKKELLRQYCSQDMNMDDPAGGAVTGQAVAPTAAPPVNRTVITIPKAVASMTSIPTREDYKAVVDANMEKKRRKEKAITSSISVPRELRHLDLPLDQDDACPPERRRSVGSTGSNASSTHQHDSITPPMKRRGRPPKSAVPASGPILVLAPKLKIKIGNNIIGAPEAESNVEEKKLRVRPPKKRLTTSVPMPTVEELKRESMKFRRMIMADFDEAEKKQSKVIAGKRRKQRQFDSSQHEVQIITADERVSAPKLIIRINKRSANSVSNSGANTAGGIGSTPVPQLSEEVESRVGISAFVSTRADPSAPPGSENEGHPSTNVASIVADGNSDGKGSDLLNVRTSKVTPIRLKLARCQEGYIMKTQPSQDTATSDSATRNIAEDGDSSTLPTKKVCEVR
ncbi:hypothetical protein B7P43_G08031 [Cryptotermes secundus]|uniref:PHD finger protein rhinoceros n=4 Tax=Cryptotermes secundus TaxID=105785 RepID=A0A2J7R806_9NEOP|nr:hypothetical protein B7P43_G08031 [Cryptotermes secundus]